MGEKESECDQVLIDKLCEGVLQLDEGALDVASLDELEVATLQECFQREGTQLKEAVVRLGLSDRLSEGLFYPRLAQISAVLPYSDSSHDIVGRIWCFQYANSDAANQARLVSEFTTCGDFFAHLDSLPAILSIGEFATETLASWLREIYRRIADDVCAPLFNGVSVLARSRPETAEGVLGRWISEKLDESTISLAAHLLAELREQDSTLIADHETILRGSDSEDRKRVYFYSWSRTDDVTRLAFFTFREVFEEMKQSLGADECLRFLCRALNRKGRCRESFEYALSWVRDNLPDEPSDSWRHWLIDLSESTFDQSVEFEVKPLFHHVPMVLPIPEDHKGTRRRLDGLLAKLFSYDREGFVELVFGVSTLDARSLHKIFDPHKHHALQGAISRANAGQLASFFLAGDSADFRRVGMNIFQRNNVEALMPVEGSPWDEKRIGRIIFQIGSEAPIDFPVARLMIALEAPTRQCENEQLKVVFVEQLVYHMKNLPGACLEEVKQSQKTKQSPLFKDAIKKAEKYLSELSKVRETGINSLQIAGYQKASQTLGRRRRREIQRASEGSGSLVSLLARKSYLTYGGGDWQIVTGGRPGDVTSSQEFSHSMEFPRMPSIDPEGYGDWKLNCWKYMQGLDEDNSDERA